MLKIKGIYDGTKIVLIDSLPLPPNSVVEVLIPEPPVNPEQLYWQRLLELGLIRELLPRLQDDQPVVPVQVTGTPVSQTIIEERR